MAEVEELLDGVVVRLPAAEEIRARGRRRSRRRTTTVVVCTVALMAAGAWAVLPTGADQRHKHETVATAPDNPFRKDGLVQMMRADEVPRHGTWHWKEDERPTTGAGSQGDPLPYLGLDGACADAPLRWARSTRPVTAGGTRAGTEPWPSSASSSTTTRPRPGSS